MGSMHLIHAVLFAAFLSPTALAGPPPTEVEPVTETLHGREVVDNYRWLEGLEAESERVREWTTAQNEYTRSVLDNLPGRTELEARLSELMSVGFVGAPIMRGDRYFYEERTGAQNQPVLHVRKGHDATPRALIDPNTLDDEGLYSLDWFEPSEDGELLAFGLSYAGDEMTVLHVMHVESDEWLSDEIPGKVSLSGWLPDGSGFVYSRLADPTDPYSRQIKVHELGRHHRHDPVLFAQQEASRIPFAGISRDADWIVIGVTDGWARNDLHVGSFDEWRRTGILELLPVAVGEDARFSPEAIRGDTMYMQTTLDAPNGRVLTVNLNDPGRENWREIIPARDDAVVQSVHEADDILAVEYERNASTRIDTFDLKGAPLGAIELPGLGSASLSTRYDRTKAFLSFASYNEPRSVYRIDLEANGEHELWARPEVPVDPSIVEVSQSWYSSRDGTRVPMFIVHRKDLELDGDTPCLLYGYGGFNISLTPYFNATLFPWIEQGGIYAVANLRGGSEFGEAWHRAGMLEKKQNVFDDFYAAAEYLIDQNYTSPEHLAVRGGSNGGLLTGVAVTQRPALFAAAVSAVPLLDMARYHKFLMAKFWVPEYGSPDEPEPFEWLMEYSPYHNIDEDADYPAVLFTAGENDNRVHPMHARKMAAALQNAPGNTLEGEPILLWVDRDAGHGSGKPLSLRIRDAADTWSFIMWQTGMLDQHQTGQHQTRKR